MNKWRFIDSGFCDPVYNMGLDKALFKSFLAKKSMPVFRLYRWLRPAISLGRFQQPEKVLNLKKCQEDGVLIIKRITGGLGIYHSPDELTYSLVCPADFIGRLAVKDSYRKITYFLIQTYRRLGFRAEYSESQSASDLRHRAVFCFSQQQGSDILVEGKKIGGNAQRRKKGVIFQHGSIPLRLPNNLQAYFLERKEAKGKYLALSEIGITNIDNFRDILLDSFQSCLDVQLITSRVSQKEKLEYAAGIA